MISDTIPLSRIIRISPLNPRQDMESDVSELAATIRSQGLTDPLVVAHFFESADSADVSYEVLAGGRRWRALKSLGDLEAVVPVRIFEGDEAAARELALALAVTHKPHHPVEEYEAFAALERAGLEVARIAADFGLSERHVRQRLALGKLSPRLRSMWRKGEIDADAARAWATGSVEAQEAALDGYLATGQGWQINRPGAINARLRGDAMAPDAREALFLAADPARLDAYRAAGGRVEQDLFDDGLRFLDAPIAERVAEELLRAEAKRIAAEEGWGQAQIYADGFGESIEDAETTDEEADRLDAIEAARAEAATDEERARLDDEAEAIMTAALLRAFTPEQRATFAVSCDIGHDGKVIVWRGLDIIAETAPAGESGEETHAPPEEGDEAQSDATPPPPQDDAAKQETTEPANPFADPPKALREVIDEAASGALRAIAARRGDIALMLAVASLGCMYGGAVVKLNGAHAAQVEHELLERIRHKHFADALKICAAASTNDLSVALFALVAQSIKTEGETLEAIGKVCAAMRKRGVDLAGEFERALDRRAFFEAAPKDATLRVVSALIGPGEAKAVKGYKKDKLAAHAATLSRDKQHLPPPFADWAAAPGPKQPVDDAIDTEAETPPQPLAQAMAEAIRQDEAAPAKKQRKPRAPKTERQDA